MYYKYNPFLISAGKWNLSSPGRFCTFLLRSFVFFAFTLYCTLFLAVATPFFPPHFLPVYACGAVLMTHRLIHLVAAIFFFTRNPRFSLHFLDSSMVLHSSSGTVEILYEDVEFISTKLIRICEVDMGKDRIVIPLLLLSRDEYIDFLANFEEILPERAALLRRLRDSAEALFTATVLAVHIIQFLVQNYYIPTESMRETLVENDNIFAEKISYGIRIPRMAGMADEVVLHPFKSIPRHGEIVIFLPPEGENQSHEYIKRVIALPGDKLEISEGEVIINGSPLDEPYVTGETNLNFSGFSIEGIVPEGKVVVMGDNRGNSRDSRVFGYLPLENIRGRALFLYFNWNYIKSFDFSRFGPIR